MKTVTTVVLLLLFLGVTRAAEEKKPAPDAEPETGIEKEFLGKFAKNLFLAEHLAGYDAAAWVSGDESRNAPIEVRKKIRIWFACAEEDGWHVVYGAMDEKKEKFTRHLHHLVKSGKDVTTLKDLETKDDDLAIALALEDSSARLRKLPIGKRIAFNPYVVRDEKEIHIWVLPQITPDWVIVFGNSHRYRYSVDGKKFIDHKAWDYGLDGAKVCKENREKEIRIGSKDLDAPTVADLFTLIRFEKYFESIKVVSAYGITLRMKGGMWTHLVWPDLAPETKPKPEKKSPEEAKPPKKEKE